MYFGTKSYLKSNYYHTAKHPLSTYKKENWRRELENREEIFVLILDQQVSFQP